MITIAPGGGNYISGKPFWHKGECSLGRKCVCNYRAEVGMLSYIQ